MVNENQNPFIHELSEICDGYENNPSALLEILHDVQQRQGHIAPEYMLEIAERLNLGKAEVHGAMSFYQDFKDAPCGKVVVKVCQAEACQSMGAGGLNKEMLARYGASISAFSKQDVSFEPVYCLGNCALAPAAMVDGKLYGRVDTLKLQSAIEEAIR